MEIRFAGDSVPQDGSSINRNNKIYGVWSFPDFIHRTLNPVFNDLEIRRAYIRNKTAIWTVNICFNPNGWKS